MIHNKSNFNLIRLNMIGSSFGRWTVIGTALPDKHRNVQWLCECECGTRRDVRGRALKNGTSQSCGCLKIETFIDRNRKRYSSDTLEYGIWRSMVQRCHLPSTKAFKHYGALGITVCARWRNGTKTSNGFECFMDDMGARPSSKHSIDRINTNKGYFKNNCRWATKEQQANNCKSNRLVTFKWQTKTLTEWSRLLGLNYPALQYRLNHGWTVKEAFTTPIRA
jgi:hypothetical protein